MAVEEIVEHETTGLEGLNHLHRGLDDHGVVHPHMIIADNHRFESGGLRLVPGILHSEVDEFSVLVGPQVPDVEEFFVHHFHRHRSVDVVFESDAAESPPLRAHVRGRGVVWAGHSTCGHEELRVLAVRVRHLLESLLGAGEDDARVLLGKAVLAGQRVDLVGSHMELLDAEVVVELLPLVKEEGLEEGMHRIPVLRRAVANHGKHDDFRFVFFGVGQQPFPEMGMGTGFRLGRGYEIAFHLSPPLLILLYEGRAVREPL